VIFSDLIYIYFIKIRETLFLIKKLQKSLKIPTKTEFSAYEFSEKMVEWHKHCSGGRPRRELARRQLHRMADLLLDPFAQRTFGLHSVFF
jgi:hypothetical protein